MDSYAVATTGESLWIEDDSGNLKEVVEIKSSPALMRTPQKLDCTHYKCSVMTYKDGIPDLGSDLSWTANVVPRGSPNSNLELVSGLNRTKNRKIVVKLPLARCMIVLNGQVSWGLAARSVNGILDLTISVTPSSDFSIVSLNETYRVTYNGGSATGTVTDTDAYTPGDEVEVKPSTGLTYAGHQFVEWNTSADGTGKGYQPGESFMIFDNTTLYAQWITDGTDVSTGEKNLIENPEEGA